MQLFWSVASFLMGHTFYHTLRGLLGFESSFWPRRKVVGVGPEENRLGLAGQIPQGRPFKFSQAKQS